MEGAAEISLSTSCRKVAVIQINWYNNSPSCNVRGRCDAEIRCDAVRVAVPLSCAAQRSLYHRPRWPLATCKALFEREKQVFSDSLSVSKYAIVFRKN